MQTFGKIHIYTNAAQKNLKKSEWKYMMLYFELRPPHAIALLYHLNILDYYRDKNDLIEYFVDIPMFILTSFLGVLTFVNPNLSTFLSSIETIPL